MFLLNKLEICFSEIHICVYLCKKQRNKKHILSLSLELVNLDG
jgi:hypothetical protein